MQPPARAARIEAAEQLSMAQLLAAYADATSMAPDVLAAAEAVLKASRHCRVLQLPTPDPARSP
jgi:hypothetical protein